jgi:hypothetical protein
MAADRVIRELPRVAELAFATALVAATQRHAFGVVLV